MVDLPKRYDVQRDELVVVDQDWVNKVQALLISLAVARRAAHRACEIRDGLVYCPPPELQAFLDAWKPEFPTKIEDVIKEARVDD